MLAGPGPQEFVATCRYGVSEIDGTSAQIIDLTGLSEKDWKRLESDMRARGLADWDSYFRLILAGLEPELFREEA